LKGEGLKVLVVLPTAKGMYPPEAEQRRVDVLRSYSTPEVEVEVGFPAEAAGFVPMTGGVNAGVGSAQNHILVAERMIKAEQEGYDACFPFGMIDFGVEIARSSCNIPIVGQAQATYCMAAMMSHRFGSVSYLSNSHANARRQLQEYGFEHLCVGMGAAEMTNSEMPKRRQELYDRFVSEGKRLVKDGAELIVCHGMAMSPVEFKAEEFAEGIGVPVLEGVGCALAMAVAWVQIGTPYSRVRYRRPQ
jgi:Asp/Glu/hydantoin racemase